MLIWHPSEPTSQQIEAAAIGLRWRKNFQSTETYNSDNKATSRRCETVGIWDIVSSSKHDSHKKTDKNSDLSVNAGNVMSLGCGYVDFANTLAEACNNSLP